MRGDENKRIATSLLLLIAAIFASKSIAYEARFP